MASATGGPAGARRDAATRAVNARWTRRRRMSVTASEASEIPTRDPKPADAGPSNAGQEVEGPAVRARCPRRGAGDVSAPSGSEEAVSPVRLPAAAGSSGRQWSPEPTSPTRTMSAAADSPAALRCPDEPATMPVALSASPCSMSGRYVAASPTRTTRPVPVPSSTENGCGGVDGDDDPADPDALAEMSSQQGDVAIVDPPEPRSSRHGTVRSFPAPPALVPPAWSRPHVPPAPEHLGAGRAMTRRIPAHQGGCPPRNEARRRTADRMRSGRAGGRSRRSSRGAPRGVPMQGSTPRRRR